MASGKTSHDYYNVTWRDVESNVNAVQQKLDQMRWYPEFVIAAARGGLIPTVMLSHRLRIPMSIITISTYDANETKKVGQFNNSQGILYDPITGSKMMWEDLACLNSTEALLIDDICDTGETLAAVSNHLPLIKIATLFQKVDPANAQPFFVDNWIHRGQVIPYHKWVLFPWESQ